MPKPKVDAKLLLKLFALGVVGWGERDNKTLILTHERLPKEALATIKTFFCEYFGLSDKEVGLLETGPFFRLTRGGSRPTSSTQQRPHASDASKHEGDKAEEG